MSIFKKTEQKIKVSSKVVVGFILAVVVAGGAILYLTYPRLDGLREISRVLEEIDNDDDNNCGPGTSACGNGCCPNDTTCCGGDACCSDGYQCKGTLGVNWCYKAECGEDEFRCGEGDRGICCPNDKACVTVGLGLVRGRVYRCGDGQCQPGQSACRASDTEGGKICCDANETCIEISGVPACKSTSCDQGAGESLCVGGEGRYEDLAICCPSDKTCFRHPNGYPQCR